MTLETVSVSNLIPSSEFDAAFRPNPQPNPQPNSQLQPATASLAAATPIQSSMGLVPSGPLPEMPQPHREQSGAEVADMKAIQAVTSQVTTVRVNSENETSLRSRQYREAVPAHNESESPEHEDIFELYHFDHSTSSLAGSNLLLMAHSTALVSKPAKLTAGHEFDQLSQWSMNNPQRSLLVEYRGTNGLDQSGLTKHALTASFSTVPLLPIIRQMPDGLRLVPLDEIEPEFANRGLVNRNALQDCAKLAHIFGRLLAQNIKVIKEDANVEPHLKINIKFSPTIYRALTVFSDVNKGTARTLKQLLKIAKQPEKSNKLTLKQLLQYPKSQLSALALLDQLDDLGLKKKLKALLALEQNKKSPFSFLTSKRSPSEKSLLREQIKQHLYTGLKGEVLEAKEISDQDVILALAEKFAPYLELGKIFDQMLQELNINHEHLQDLVSTFFSDLTYKQWFAEDEDAFDQAFSIIGLDEDRKQDPKIDEMVKEGFTDFFNDNSEETAVDFAHFVTASKGISKDTKITLSLHNDERYDMPQSHTCPNQLDVYLGLFKPGPDGKNLLNRNLLLSLDNYEDDPFGMK